MSRNTPYVYIYISAVQNCINIWIYIYRCHITHMYIICVYIYIYITYVYNYISYRCFRFSHQLQGFSGPSLPPQPSHQRGPDLSVPFFLSGETAGFFMGNSAFFMGKSGKIWGNLGKSGKISKFWAKKHRLNWLQPAELSEHSQIR